MLWNSPNISSFFFPPFSFSSSQAGASKSPHSPLLTLPTAPCALLTTTLRAPHLTLHCHSPTSPHLPLSPGTWLRTAPRRTPADPGGPQVNTLHLSFFFCLLRCGQTVFVFALQEHLLRRLASELWSIPTTLSLTCTTYRRFSVISSPSGVVKARPHGVGLTHRGDLTGTRTHSQVLAGHFHSQPSLLSSTPPGLQAPLSTMTNTAPQPSLYLSKCLRTGRNALFRHFSSVTLRPKRARFYSETANQTNVNRYLN